MQTQKSECAICGRRRTNEDGWFLLTESRWQDKITILQWHDQLAGQHGVQRVCNASHAQRLVVHWMATGGLDYPFAFTQKEKPEAQRRKRLPESRTVDLRGARPIGELAIHRESIQRVLRDSPHSLTAILEALLCALERTQPPAEVPMDVAATEVLCEAETSMAWEFNLSWTGQAWISSSRANPD
jgi:hypothetical protein